MFGSVPAKGKVNFPHKMYQIEAMKLVHDALHIR